MRLIYVLGPAHGKVEEFTPAWGDSWLPPEYRKQPLGKVDPELGELFVEYVVISFNKMEAHYIPKGLSKSEAIRTLHNMTGACNES